MPRLRRHATALLLFTALAIPACSSDDARQPSGGDTSSAGSGTDSTEPEIDLSGVTLRVGTTTENGQGLIRDQSGIFADAPYKVEWVELNGSNALIEALNGGAIDLAPTLQMPATVLAQANATEPWTTQSAAFHVISAWEYLDNPGFVVSVHPDSPITEVSQLAGSRIAYAKGAHGQYFWLKARLAEGLADGDVEEVVLPAPEGRTAFRSGDVDALISGYQTGVQFEGEGIGRIIATSAEYTEYISLSVARKGLLDEPSTAAAVADFLARTAAIEQWMQDNIDIVADVFGETFGLNADDAMVNARAELKVRVPLDDFTIGVMRDMVATFFDAGIARTEPDVLLIVDTRLDVDIVRSP